MTKIKWEMQEAGWYTSELGGICKEKDGWYFYPIELQDADRKGPYKTLAEAKQKAEKKD